VLLILLFMTSARASGHTPAQHKRGSSHNVKGISGLPFARFK